MLERRKMEQPSRIITDTERKFVRIFRRLSQAHSSWIVWQDFIFMSAAAIANALDKRPEVWRKREDEYLAIVNKYSKDEQHDIIELFTLTAFALEVNPAQDFLGRLYMQLELSNHWHGQFFTPWDIAEVMARITAGDSLKERISSKDYISVNDPACGAGCMLLAFASVCLNFGVNYQQSVLFTGQDIDAVAAKMSYIQLSLLGCPGYVVIGNTITDHVLGDVLSPVYKNEGDIWFTPMYFSNLWLTRRLKKTNPALRRIFTKGET